MKKILATLLVSSMILLSIGCNDNQSSTTTVAKEGAATTTAGSTTKGSQPNEQVIVDVLCAFASEDPHGKYIYQYAEDYSNENPNVKVEVTAISSNDIYTKLAAMATNPEDIPVMFFTSVDQAPQLFDLGLLEDLHDHFSEEELAMFANGVVDASTLDGQMAFFPVDVQPSAVIYRKDRFTEAGLDVPTNWEDFLTAAQTLTKDTDNDGEVDQWGFSMVGSNNSSGQSRFLSYLWSQGYNVVENANGKWVTDIGTPQFVDAFSYWTDLNNVHQVVPIGITEVDYAVAANYFAMGYTSMILSGSNAMGVAYANNPELKGKLGSFVIPGDHPGTMLNAEGYAISNHASDAEKAAAVDYLKYFVTNDSELNFWQTSGKIPSTVEGQKAEYITGDDYAGYLKTIELGCIAPVNFAGMGGLKSILGDSYSAVFSGEKSNQEAVETLRTELESLISEYE